MITVDELRDLLADLPGYHPVEIDALNGSPPRLLSAVAQQTRQAGPTVVLW